jgi:CRISPR/Cas system-associated exonuclease Cas4 (RecB family)
MIKMIEVKAPEIKLKQKRPGRNTLRLKLRVLTEAYLVEREVDRELASSYLDYNIRNGVIE